MVALLVSLVAVILGWEDPRAVAWLEPLPGSVGETTALVVEVSAPELADPGFAAGTFAFAEEQDLALGDITAELRQHDEHWIQRWRIPLVPRRAGNIKIPPLAIELAAQDLTVHTPPLTFDVAATTEERAVRVEWNWPKTLYVGQVVSLLCRLHCEAGLVGRARFEWLQRSVDMEWMPRETPATEGVAVLWPGIEQPVTFVPEGNPKPAASKRVFSRTFWMKLRQCATAPEFELRWWLEHGSKRQLFLVPVEGDFLVRPLPPNPYPDTEDLGVGEWQIERTLRPLPGRERVVVVTFRWPTTNPLVLPRLPGEAAWDDFVQLERRFASAGGFDAFHYTLQAKQGVTRLDSLLWSRFDPVLGEYRRGEFPPLSLPGGEQPRPENLWWPAVLAAVLVAFAALAWCRFLLRRQSAPQELALVKDVEELQRLLERRLSPWCNLTQSGWTLSERVRAEFRQRPWFSLLQEIEQELDARRFGRDEARLDSIKQDCERLFAALAREPHQ